MTNELPPSSLGAATAGAWLTATNLVLIAIGVILALLVIWWGAKLKRQRRAVDRVIEDRAEDAAPAPFAASLDDTPPPAPETEPAPFDPAPPPLADTPVVAAAPFDAGPAAIAADLATPPAPAPATPAATPDDLTRMKGIGPKLAARLGDLGITRFAQIAALTPAEAIALDAQLGTFQGRIARDRWIEQAGYLANDDRAGFEAAFGRL
ncbi:hypothetical protein [Sphingomonas sp.]|uniref:hypothetical protein n=1 Tax=Sphingomonas sp. TaxID=28214 RepID=UPI002EDA2DE9